MKKVDLKSARMRLSLSVQEMAETMNTSIRTYQGWEQGRKIPGIVSVCIELLEKQKK